MTTDKTTEQRSKKPTKRLHYVSWLAACILIFVFAVWTDGPRFFYAELASITFVIGALIIWLDGDPD